MGRVIPEGWSHGDIEVTAPIEKWPPGLGLGTIVTVEIAGGAKTWARLESYRKHVGRNSGSVTLRVFSPPDAQQAVDLARHLIGAVYGQVLHAEAYVPNATRD